MVLYGSSWFLMVLHGSSWFFMVPHGSSWFLMVPRGSSWLLMVALHEIVEDFSLLDPLPSKSSRCCLNG